MQIYTSYFYQVRNMPSSVVPISIARFSPKWFNGLEFKALAPSELLLQDYKRGMLSEKEYIARYCGETLGTLDQFRVYYELQRLSAGRDVVLCCHEPAGKFCHRFIVTVWLNQEGFKVIEWHK